MIRTVPQWQQKSHCAVDIYVSSLPVQTKKLTTDRLRIISAAQTINVCAVHCSFVLFSFPGKKNRKKVTAIKNGKPTMTDQQHQAKRTAAGPYRSIKSPNCTLIEQFKLKYVGKKNKPDL
jgi:hypothetical protein